MKTALGARIIGQHLDDFRIDLVIGECLGAVISKTVQGWLRRKPIPACFFIKIGGSLTELPKRLTENGKLIPRLSTSEPEARPCQARVRLPNQRRRTQEDSAGSTSCGSQLRNPPRRIGLHALR